MKNLGPCIALGDFAVATKPYEFVLRVSGLTATTILTPEEFETVSKILHRLDIKKDH